MHRGYSFDAFVIDIVSRRLLREGVPQALGGRAFDVLCLLIEHRERVVDKQELLDTVWRDLVVEDNNLTVQISALRKCLGNDAITTIARRGYRFTRPVVAWSDELVQGGTARPERPPGVVLCVLAPSIESGEPMGAWYRAAVLSHGGESFETGDTRARVASDRLAWFATARAAAACAQRLHECWAAESPGMPGLRIGLAEGLGARRHAQSLWAQAGAAIAPESAEGHEAALRSCEGPAMAQALAYEAAAGETLTTPTVRDGLTDGLDCRAVDLGSTAAAGQPVLQRFRLAPLAGGLGGLAWPDDRAALKPLLMVVPFTPRLPDGPGMAVGDLIADGLISALSHSRHPWRVVSRLSAASYRGLGQGIELVAPRLGAAYVISGSHVVQDDRVMIDLQVADTRTGEVCAARRLHGPLSDLLASDSRLLAEILGLVREAIHAVELQRVRMLALPDLAGHTLLLGGIQLLHRNTEADFALSRQLLQRLIDLHPRAHEPRLWLAKWFAMRAVQGQAADLRADAHAALACTRHVLSEDPLHAFALAMEGFVHTHLTHDQDAARECLSQALALNHSETFAHLYSGVMHGVAQDFRRGIQDYRTALLTSPHDPARYMFDSIGAYLHLGAGEHAQALALARESLRQNAHHAHSWRVITIAQQEMGEGDLARQSLQRVLSLQPDLTVHGYVTQGRPGDGTRERFARALATAGLPLR